MFPFPAKVPISRYYAVDDSEKVKALPEDQAQIVNDSIQSGKQGSFGQRGKIPCLHAHLLPSLDRLLSAKGRLQAC